MKSSFALLISLLCCSALVHAAPGKNRVASRLNQSVDAQWLVVGAGPAGIATVGVLLDIGVDPHTITWLDPEFNVGRLGAYYGSVPANTTSQDFVDFISACDAFHNCMSPSLDYLFNEVDLTERHELQVVIDPLRDITQYLRDLVVAEQDMLNSLFFVDDCWSVGTATGKTITANHVVLASGSHPKTLDVGVDKIIPLDLALNPENLQQMVKSRDVVGVVGSSHSAVLLLKFLSELPFTVKQIYNLYKEPLTYAFDEEDNLVNPFLGLKGIAADWARTVLEPGLAKNISRVKGSPKSIRKTLEKCSKVIYAIGYQKNDLPDINDMTPIIQKEAGMIAPRLFGIGIAFPEKQTSCLGQEGYCVGLDCFMNYAQAMIPQWALDDMFKGKSALARHNQIRRLACMKDLFTISLL